MTNSKTVHISQRIGEELEKIVGKSKRVHIKLLHEREVSAFIKKIEEAHQNTAKSKLIFK